VGKISSRLIAAIIVSALLAGCGGSHKDILPTPNLHTDCTVSPLARHAMMCNSGTPSPSSPQDWGYAFYDAGSMFNTSLNLSSGNVTGPSYAHKTFSGCLSEDAHNLIADATALLGALKSQMNVWSSGPMLRKSLNL